MTQKKLIDRSGTVSERGKQVLGQGDEVECKLMGGWTGQTVMSLGGLSLTRMSPEGVLGVPRVICRMIDRGLTWHEEV